MVRRGIIAWLAFTVLMGPQLCCCAIFGAVTNRAQAGRANGHRCCCGESAIARIPVPLKTPPRKECPCKKSGRQVLLAVTPIPSAELGNYAPTDGNAAFDFPAFVGGPSISALGRSVAFANRPPGGRIARGLCPILRC